MEPRDAIVSSFTIIKGALIEPTYEILAQWDPVQSKRKNLERLRNENPIGATSSKWLRDVAWVISRRFDPSGYDGPLALLAKNQFPLEEWKPILLWHITRNEFLLRDFLEFWLFRAYDNGSMVLLPEHLHEYLRNIGSRGGTIEHRWSDVTLRRVASGLLKMGVDFGLLRGRSTKRFASYHLPERSFLYLLHAIKERLRSPGRVISAPDWRLFLMQPSGVEHELLRLHQYHRLEYQVAGSLVQLSLPFDNVMDYASSIVA